MTGEFCSNGDCRSPEPRASMRPRSNDRGIERLARQLAVDGRASMRPRSNDRGIPMHGQSEHTTIGRFNEAPIK